MLSSIYDCVVTKNYYQSLSPALRQLTDEIEQHCGFEITVTWNPRIVSRGLLYHGPKHITIVLKALSPNPAVICHELCHAERYFRLGVPFIQLGPPREILGVDGDMASDAAENLDNMLEHIIVLSEMKTRFGFDFDPTHVREDLSTYHKWPKDEFSRRCLALCNAALVYFHFPELSPEMEFVLKTEGLAEIAQDLNRNLGSSLHSKPRMVEALAKALGIPFVEVQLRARNVREGCDVGAPLVEWLIDNKDTYQVK